MYIYFPGYFLTMEDVGASHHEESLLTRCAELDQYFNELDQVS